jgi:hypothetical protein
MIRPNLGVRKYRLAIQASYISRSGQGRRAPSPPAYSQGLLASSTLRARYASPSALFLTFDLTSDVYSQEAVRLHTTTPCISPMFQGSHRFRRAWTRVSSCIDCLPTLPCPCIQTSYDEICAARLCDDCKGAEVGKTTMFLIDGPRLVHTRCWTRHRGPRCQAFDVDDRAN